MRDVDRIEKILLELEIYWLSAGNQDLRLGQIITNLLPIGNNNDIFYLEDQELLDLLREANNKE